MHFKLLIALVDENTTDKALTTARESGATGATVIHNARGEGLEVSKTFFGLTLETQRDMLLFLVEEHLSRKILERVADKCDFEKDKCGVIFQIDVEDVVGLAPQIRKLTDIVEEEI